MKSSAWLYVALTLWLATAPPVRADDSVPRWEAADCPAAAADTVPVECGYLVVPEDHNRPGERTLRIAVAILKSPNPTPAPDPLVFLNGGPGGHTLKFLPELASAFEPFLTSRDVILFDQRGLGFSQPALDCPELDRLTEAGTTQVLDFDRSLPSIKGALADCRARHEGQGVSLAAYTSAQSVLDLDALRTVLGYREWNLFGGSYGTRYALTAMRDRPAGIRSAILASVYPLQVSLYDAVRNADRAYNVLFDGCAADAACNLFYPNLKTVFYDLVARLNAHPVVVEVETRSGEVRRRTLTGDLLMDVVFNLLYSAESTVLLPALIYDLHEGVYTLPRQMLARSTTDSLAPAFSPGMAFSVQCSEEIPFTTREQILDAAAPYPEPIRRYMHQRLLFTDLAPELCQSWITVQPDPIENEPVRSDIPALVLAGYYDPVTPPAWSREAALYLSHSYYYEFPSLGHTIKGVCPTAIMLGFLNDPGREPESSCIRRMVQRPRFIIRAEVSRLPASVAAVLAAGVVLGQAVKAGHAAWRRRQFTWRVSARLIGWVPVMVSGALAALLLLTAEAMSDSAPMLSPARVVETVIPIAAALHAALLFSPEDEPALEVTVAAPRPMAWTLLERWGLVVAGHGTLGVMAAVAAMPVSGEALVVAMARWLAPMSFLVGAAICVTLTTRQPALSAGLMLLVWFGLSWAGDAVLVRWPFLWPVQAYLQPDHDFYWLNRALLCLIGAGLIVLAARIVNDDERMLFGKRTRGARLRPAEEGW